MPYIKNLPLVERALLRNIRAAIQDQINESNGLPEKILATTEAPLIFAGYLDGFVWKIFHMGRFARHPYTVEEFFDRASFILENTDSALLDAYTHGKACIEDDRQKKLYDFGNKIAAKDSIEMLRDLKRPTRLYRYFADDLMTGDDS